MRFYTRMTDANRDKVVSTDMDEKVGPDRLGEITAVNFLSGLGRF